MAESAENLGTGLISHPLQNEIKKKKKKDQC